MRATLIHRFMQAYRGGRIEGVIWKVPEPVAPTQHGYKYRLVYVVNGERIVGYDNEHPEGHKRGKGDHRHIRGRETPYRFVDVPTLISDFIKDVEQVQ